MKFHKMNENKMFKKQILRFINLNWNSESNNPSKVVKSAKESGAEGWRR